jgi:hypothetical protein
MSETELVAQHAPVRLVLDDQRSEDAWMQPGPGPAHTECRAARPIPDLASSGNQH